MCPFCQLSLIEEEIVSILFPFPSPFTWIENSRSTKWSYPWCSRWNRGLPITNVPHFSKGKISDKPKIIQLCLAKWRPSTVAIKERVWSPAPPAKRWYNKLLGIQNLRNSHKKPPRKWLLEWSIATPWTTRAQIMTFNSEYRFKLWFLHPDWATGDCQTVRHLGWFRSSSWSMGSVGSLIASSTISCQRLVDDLHVPVRLAQ